MTLLKQTTVSKADDTLTASENELETDCCVFSLTGGSLEKGLRTLTLSDTKPGKRLPSCESGIASFSANYSMESTETNQGDNLHEQTGHSGAEQTQIRTNEHQDRTEKSWFQGDCDNKIHFPTELEEQFWKKKDKSETSVDNLDDLCEKFPDKDGDTLLHLAVLQTVTHLARLVRFLGLQGQVNCRNHLYQTPLHLAVLTANTQALTLLFHHMGASLCLQDSHGNTPLHIACLRNDPHALKMLLEEDEMEAVGSRNMEAGEVGDIDSESDSEGETLHAEAEEGGERNSARLRNDSQTSGILLEKEQGSKNTKSSDVIENLPEDLESNDRGETLSKDLERTQDGHAERVSKKLKSTHGVDKNQETQLGELGGTQGDDRHQTVPGELIDADRVEEDMERRRERREREVKVALCMKNYEGFTCLHLAVLHGSADLVNLLLKHGADVNVRDAKSGRTALHLAVDTPHPSSPVLSALLLHPHLHINATNFAQQTALQLARGRHHLDLVDLLHVHGADWSDSIHGYYSSDGFSEEDAEEDLFLPYNDLRVAGQLLASARCS